jgi:hypothetical protein
MRRVLPLLAGEYVRPSPRCRPLTPGGHAKLGGLLAMNAIEGEFPGIMMASHAAPDARSTRVRLA